MTWTCRRPAPAPCRRTWPPTPRRHDDDDPPGHRARGPRAGRGVRAGGLPARPGPAWPRLDRWPRSTRRWSPGCATTCARTASARSCSACPAASTPRSSPRSPATRSAPTSCTWCSMPSRYSSEHSRDDAADLAERQGLHPRTVPIAPMVDAFLASFRLTGLAEENLQARVRGVILMALSNQEGHLVLATGNKSELAVGYSTIYGDSVGGFAPDQGRAQDAGVGAGPVAQRGGRPARARPRRSRRTRSPSRRPPSCAPGSSTPTRCPTTRCSTPSWTTTSRRTGRGRAGRRRVRPGPGRPGDRAGRPGRVQAPPVPARPEDLPALRPRPPAADHQPLGRATPQLTQPAGQARVAETRTARYGMWKMPPNRSMVEPISANKSSRTAGASARWSLCVSSSSSH